MLCDDNVADCDDLLASIPDVTTLFNRHTSDEVQQMLDEYLSTDSSSEANSSETTKYNNVKNNNKVDAAFSKLMANG